KYLPRLSTQEGQTLDRMTHTIIQQVEAMKEMVNTFSNYARSPQMHWQAVDINQLIKDVVELYQQEHSTIQLHLDETLPLIEADRGRLRQSLHNLIKNALEAAPKLSPITVTSHYLAAPALNCVELHIHDQGSGIPETLIEKIFEPYVTTKTKGSGLGLAIVKKIVEEHHGMVWIANQGGACVHIRLPICRPQAETHDSTYSRC
ncbi:MAG: ATP-binding protein, partial [Pseudomonadota bacterium]|nr:ATP-binding protein [Pseudomonadota bacterium]